MKMNKRSFVLITALLVSSILIAITVAYVSRVATEYKLMSKVYNSTAALDLAEAGIDRALWEINYNGSGFSGWSTSIDGSGSQTRSISVSGFQTASGLKIGDYSVTVTISADGMSGTATGIGYVPNAAKFDEKRTITVKFLRSNFNKAVLALNGITMSGQAKTDSYNSSVGPYASQTPTQEGSIATNGSITLGSSTYVNGDANPGASYPFSGVPPVSGSYGTLQAPFTVEPIPSSVLTAAMASTNYDNITHDPKKEPVTGTSLNVSSDSYVTFGAGTYYFTSINIAGQATVNPSGTVIIYVDGGNINISGQGVINTGAPSNLQIYSTGSSINVSGQAALAAAIYAPSASVTLTGQEQFYGAIVCGQNSDSGQAKIHYDLALANLTPVFANNRITSWQELQQ